MRFMVLALSLSLSACSLGLFGGSGDEQVEVNPLSPLPDGAVFVASLESVVPEPALRGIILKSTALAASPGYHNARLRPLNAGAPDENGIVTYEFRVQPPGRPQPQGTQAARRIIAATFVSDRDLQTIAGFRVLSETNVVNLAR